MARDLDTENLPKESIEWALNHIDRFGDTDLLPTPFEYKAIIHDRNAVVTELAAIDITNGCINTNRRFLSPKPGLGFRVVTQLDPLDTIIFLAIIHSEALKLEAGRIPVDKRVACSYRVEISPDGQLFNADSGWKNFHNRSEELSQNFDYVLTADIADFYSQIYTHRIENGLEQALVTPNKARAVEKILLEWSAQQSRGIPVGPYASILLAEVCLNDVDSFLLRKNYIFTRYVDDFRIFTKTEEEARKALHDLTEYLHTAHRLTLQNHKTKILTTELFIERELVDPEKEELRENIERINEALKEYNTGASHPPELSETIPDGERRQIAIDTVGQLFSDCVEEDQIQLGLARYLLRRSAALRTKIIFDDVISNFTKLQPVIRDVSLYIIKTASNQDSERIHNVIKDFLESSELKFLDYSLEWICHLAISKSRVSLELLFHTCERRKGPISERCLALLAEELGYIDWVRERKEALKGNPSWVRRAIIKAGAILPPDERRHWGNAIASSGDCIDRAVARKYLLQR